MAKTFKEIGAEFKRDMANSTAEMKGNSFTKIVLLIFGIIITIPLLLFGLWLIFIGCVFLWDAFIGL